MRRLRLDRPASPGATLAQDVIAPGGEIIARAGHALTDRTRRALLGRDVTWCYVDDLWGADLLLAPLDGGHSTVRPPLREFQQQLGEIVAPLLTLPTQRVLETLRRTHPAAALANGRAVAAMPGAVRAFMEACAEINPVGGYLFERGTADDDGGHVIGVGAVTAHLSAILGLDSRERAELVMAALGHDIGMLFVPRSVRQMPPEARSGPERSRYEDHAVLGGVLLEPLGESSMHLSIVAAEHHEAADGTGYPRQRVGGHRVLRTAEERRDVERVALASEIVAVADAYERIVSPSPGWEGRSPAAARAILEARAGYTLNREIVRRFLASFPALPLGTDIRVAHGPYEGMQGIICALPSGRGEQSVVRLFLDPLGRPIEPIEVALADAPDTAIEIADAA